MCYKENNKWLVIKIKKIIPAIFRFFGIKTEKASGQVVVAMRDLFQVLFCYDNNNNEII